MKTTFQTVSLFIVGEWVGRWRVEPVLAKEQDKSIFDAPPQARTGCKFKEGVLE